MCNNINSRLKYLRKTHLKITQNELGEKIGIKGSTISDIEKGKGNLTDRNLLSICEKFNVNEEWLRDGNESNGIFKPLCNISQDEINELSEKYNLDEFGKIMLKKFLQLDQDDRNGLINYIKALIPAFAELENLHNKKDKQENLQVIQVPARGGHYEIEQTEETKKAMIKDLEIDYKYNPDDF